MANTVNILSFNNTFGDLVAQQNKAAVEINNIGANNYTKDSGTLILAGSGTGLSVSNTAVLGTAIISGNTNLLGAVTAVANVILSGSGFGLSVSNNAVIAKTLITDTITSNTLIRTGTFNASGSIFVNDVTANTIIRSQTLNATGATYTDAVVANTVISAPIFNGSTSGTFNNITSNNTVSTQNVIASGIVSAVTGTFSGTITGQAVLSSVSTAVTPSTNTSNTQIATTAFVQNTLNSGNNFNISVTDGVVTTGSYSNPSWITSIAGSKVTGNISGSAALNPLINPASGQKDGDILVSGSTIYIWAAGAYRQIYPAIYT